MPNGTDDVFSENSLPPKDQRVLGAVCYLPLGFFLPYVLDKGREDFVAYHVRVGASYFFFTLLVGYVFWILWLFYFVLGAFSAYKAFSGERYLPGFVKAIVEAVNSDKK
jgi:uncharacterized membrane protein